MVKQPLISIIIVNWNGKKWLQRCFSSLKRQTYKRFEVVFVDNGSSDESVAFARKLFPKVKIVQNKSNHGFAKANNSGYTYAKGEYILLLNNDTIMAPTALEKFIEGFRTIPNAGSIQSKLIMMYEKKKLDICGSYWTDSSLLYHFGMSQPEHKKIYNSPKAFFTNKGASMMIKREVIHKLGLFDDDFWSYYEETDLCSRMWLAGYECWYYPKAIVWHAVGGTATTFPNSFIQFHNFKNKLLSFLKNFEVGTLLKVLPIFLLVNIVLSFFWLFSGKIAHFFSLYKAIFWNVQNLPRTLHKRRKIQKVRKTSDAVIFSKVKKNPNWKYYYLLLTGNNRFRFQDA